MGGLHPPKLAGETGLARTAASSSREMARLLSASKRRKTLHVFPLADDGGILEKEKAIK